MTDSAVAPIPPRTNEELNLAVLKRHKPSVTEVLQVANFAVVYIFSPSSQQWEKCGIEGTLFVCALKPDHVPGAHTPVARFEVIIINRKGMDNFSTEIFSTENVEITDEYVIVQVEGEDGTPQIYGLWIFSEPPPSSTAETRKITAERIYECAVKAEDSRRAADEEAAGMVETDKDGHAPEVPLDYNPPVSEPPQTEQTSIVGRQVSMNELFAQQPQPQPQPQPHPQSQQPPLQQFMHAQRHQMDHSMQHHHHQQHPPPPPQQMTHQEQMMSILRSQGQRVPQQQQQQFQPQDPAQFFHQTPHFQSHSHQQGHPHQQLHPQSQPPPMQAYPNEYDHTLGWKQQQQYQQQRDVIGDLFRNAKQNYSG